MSTHPLLQDLLNLPAEALALRMVDEPTLIGELVAAVKRRPGTGALTRLGDAIRIAAKGLDPEASGVAVCHALAELAWLAGDDEQTRQMAHAGLRLDPHFAPLALLLARVPDDLAVGEPVKVVLKRIARRRDTPELRAAMSLHAAA